MARQRSEFDRTPVTPENENDKLRLNLDMTRSLNARVVELADHIDGDKADVVRKGIALMEIWAAAKGQKLSLALVDEEGKVATRIVVV